MSRNRMPHNNRVSASAALRTNDMWSKTIGHDPYAADAEKSQPNQDASDQAASLMLLAKMSNLSGVESRGGCKKCGMLGHMTFQCRNASAPVVAANEDSSSSSSSSDEDERPSRLNERPALSSNSSQKIEVSKKRALSDSDSDSDGDRKSSKKHKKSKDEKKKKDKKHKHKSDRDRDRDKDKKHSKHKKSKKSSRSSSP